MARGTGAFQASSMPPPHEVGVCRRLCAVSFSNFLWLFEAVRALPVSFRIRKTARACAELAPARPGLLHMKSVFVTGYALCLFATSCGFSRPRAPFLCHLATSCVFPRPRPRPFPHPRTRAPARPRTSTNTMRGPVSRPPLYPTNGPNVTACRTRSPKLRCLPTPSDAVACSTGS